MSIALCKSSTFENVYNRRAAVHRLGVAYSKSTHLRVVAPCSTCKPTVHRKETASTPCLVRALGNSQAAFTGPYGLPSPEEEKQLVDAMHKQTDDWLAFFFLFAVLASVGWCYTGQGHSMQWIHLKLHKLGVAGCTALVVILATVAYRCKQRLLAFWQKQQRRAQCIDMIPAVKADVAIIKQDVAIIKQDVAFVKQDIAEIKRRGPWSRK